MTLPVKGRRTILVDGTRFVWYVRRSPTYSQAIGASTMTLAVQKESGGQVLHVILTVPRPDNWLDSRDHSVTPRDLRRWIDDARARGRILL